MKTSKIKIGTKVIKDGYEGTVLRFYDEQMVEIKMDSGVCCVDVDNFSGKYNNNYIKPDTAVDQQTTENQFSRRFKR